MRLALSITVLVVGLAVWLMIFCVPAAPQLDPEVSRDGADGVDRALNDLWDATSTPAGDAIDIYVYLPAVMTNFLAGTGGQLSLPPVYGIVLGEGNAERENRAQEAGVAWYRIIIRWSEIEPTPPVGDVHTYNWRAYDRLVTGLRQRGLHPLVEIRSIPSWARVPQEPWRSVDCGLMSSEGLQAYSQFLTVLVERSDGDGVDDMVGSPVVRYWEIGNEPDGVNTSGSHFGLCYGDFPEEYARLLARSWDAVHEADPEAWVVFGGLAYEKFAGVFNSDPRDEVPGPDFFDSVLGFIKANPRPAGRKYFDIMNIHAYSSWMHFYNPPDVWTKYQIVRNKLASCVCGVDNVPLMNTEGGRRSDPGQSAWGQPGTAELQSRYVSQLFVRSLAADLMAVFWFAAMDFDGLGYGLLTASNEPKRAYWAYKTLTEEMSGFKYRRMLTTSDLGSGDVEGYVFKNDSGREKWVVWIPPQIGESVSRPVTFPFSRVKRVWYEKYHGGHGSPIAGAVREIADGEPDDLGPAGDGGVTLLVTVDPIYVENIAVAAGVRLTGYDDDP